MQLLSDQVLLYIMTLQDSLYFYKIDHKAMVATYA